MADDNYQKVIDKEAEFVGLWNRMDADKKLLILDDYIMYDKDGREEKDVDNITMNDAAIFARHVYNTVSRAEILREVEGEGLKDKDTSLIENFIRDINLEADSYIQYRDIPSFKDWEIMQACHRGRIARRVTLRQEDGQLAPDSFTPIDTRYLIYDYGISGLKWVANRLPRSKQDIKDEYDKEIPGTSAIVTDFWDSEVEAVYIDKERVREDKNVYGEPPFVIQVIPAGTITFDGDRILQSGESILALARDLFPAKNMFATILKSLTLKSFFNGLQLEVENVALAKKPDSPPYGRKFIAPVQKGTRGYFSMPVEDLQNSARMFYAILDEAIQHATLPKVSYGIYPSPASGVGIAQLRQAEDPVYFPRLQGLSLFWQRLYRMVIKQYVQFKMNIELGEPGFRQKYSYKDVNKDFSIKFTLRPTSPQQDMVNISTAAAVGNLIDDDTKRRDYLHLSNPTEVESKLLAEKASRLSPAVAMYDVIKALFERGEVIKANIMAEEMGGTLEQILKGQGIAQTAQPEEEQKPKQLMPMFGGGGGGRLPGTARAEEVLEEEK